MPLARAAMHAQGECLHIAQWPAVRELHQLASRHYAFEGQCFVLAAGSVLSRGDVLEGFYSLGQPGDEAAELLEAIPGEEADLILTGGSAVIGPDSHYVQGPVLDKACILYAEVCPERITEGHLVLDTQGHYSRPDVFHLEVNDQPQVNVSFASQASQRQLGTGQVAAKAEPGATHSFHSFQWFLRLMRAAKVRCTQTGEFIHDKKRH